MASYSFGKSRIDAPQNIVDDRSPDLAGMSMKLLPELVAIQQSFKLELNLVVPVFKRDEPVLIVFIKLPAGESAHPIEAVSKHPFRIHCF